MALGLRHSATLLALSVTGCALGTATPPSVDVMDVHLVGLGLPEQQLAVTLCVTNPNKIALDFNRVTAGLDVSGAPLASGQSDVAVQLPPLSSTPVPFTVVTTVQNLGPQLLGILNTGSVDYRVHGTVTMTGSLGITLPYSRSGRLDPVMDGLRLANFATDPASASPRCPAPQFGTGLRPMSPTQTML